jgi:hypothetical protein
VSEWYVIKDGLSVRCDDLFEVNRFLEHGRIAYHKRDEIAGLTLSTVFLALDHSFPGDKGDPLLWETMLFNDDEAHSIVGFSGEYSPELGCWRFSYMEEAYAFHDNKVAELRSHLKASVVVVSRDTALHTDKVDEPPCST